MTPTPPPLVQLRESQTSAPPPLPRKGWSVKRWILLALLLFVVWIGGQLIYETPAERDFRVAVAHVTSLFAADGATPAAFTLAVLKSDGLPKQLKDVKLDVAIAAPERIRVSGKIDKAPIEVGRNGQQLWVWQPAKGFGIQAEPGVPRFATAPEASIDSSKLEPLALPIKPLWINMARRIVPVRSGGEESVDGEKCRIVDAGTTAFAGTSFGQASLTLRLWVRETDGWPVQIAIADGKKVDAVLGIQSIRPGVRLPDSHWQIPRAEGANVERVALSHIQRMFRSAFKVAKPDLPTLGPATGERKLVASHGQGRLEMHDGTRVLFLKGTPEEMGKQHGTLLRPQVRDLVDRVLYGVGVGSSFGKGRWFFGEIEQCQARLAPFIDPRYLREMDAMAAAAGLEKEEIRLANFFPELFHCSGFAVMGEATSDGKIYHGRVLDYMKGIGLEGNAVVTVNQPDQGHAWVNIGYAGFTGSVTAMNDQHISIGEMGGRGEGNWDGKPMAQLVREVMEKASNLEEAIEIMRIGPRTCEYFYVIADGKAGSAVGIAATPEIFEVVRPGEAHPRLDKPVKNAVLLSAGDRYDELVRRVQRGYGKFDADAARELMTRPVCMTSNIHSVLFAPGTLDFWVANADGRNVASHTRYTKYNLGDLLRSAAQ
jgi:outer membrane lipoprotein-sorting protein